MPSAGTCRSIQSQEIPRPLERHDGGPGQQSPKNRKDIRTTLEA